VSVYCVRGLTGREDGSNECTGRRSAVDLQCGKARQATGSDPAVLKSDRQVPNGHDETWSVLSQFLSLTGLPLGNMWWLLASRH